MNEMIKNEPHAFPHMTGPESVDRGMTLWDYYVGHAITGYLANGVGKESFEDIAEFCGMLADSVLVERKKRGISNNGEDV